MWPVLSGFRSSPMIARILALTALTLLLPASLFAQTAVFRGIVYDGEDGQPLTGATVVLEDSRYNAVTGLDGSFVIRNVPFGEYTVRVSFVSYHLLSERISIRERSVDRRFDLYPDTVLLDDVVVMARRDMTTEESARATERLAPNVLNVMPARAIELSPDITVANVVQRVSGVSLERSSSGDGQHAIVRGMDKRYNYTLVNGIKIPSPDVRNRYVPLDIFPSELLDRLEVSKALTPSMEGDAIGGVIDMKMKDAPARRLLSFNVGTGFSHLLGNRDFLGFEPSVVSTKSPNRSNGSEYQTTLDDFTIENIDFRDRGLPIARMFGFAAGDRFFGDRLGAIVAGSYHNTFRGSNSIFFEMDVDRENNNPFYDTVQQREYSTEQARAGLHAKLDWNLSRSHQIDLYSAIIELRDHESRARIDTNLRIGRAAGPGTGRIGHRFRSRQQVQRIYNTTLQGDHQFRGALALDWSAVYSLATNDDPDMAELVFLTGTTRSADGSIVNEPVLVDRDFVRRWTNNTDQDIAGYANLRHERRFFGLETQLAVGGMYRHKTRSNAFDSYLLRAAPIRQEWAGNVYDLTWNLFNPIGTPTDPLNYESNEDVLGYYGQFRVQVGLLQILGGVRAEHTSFAWETNAPSTVVGRVGTRSYVDVLPSIHFKYSPSGKVNYRFSYFSSISRPNFFEVIPYQMIEEDFWERGNPNLERTQANNFDLRYERFPSALDQFMVGMFYKRIVNPIESALAIEGQRIYMQPNNFGTATNLGLEVDLTRYWRQFGVRGYYTYTNSSITTSKIYRFRDTEGNLTSRQEPQTRPLQGQSRHIGNLSLLYRNGRTGTDAQLAASHTGRRIISVSPYFGNDIWQRSFTQLDFSVEQRLARGIAMYMKINNILNTPMRADVLRPNTANPHQVPYEDVSESVKVREDFYGQTYVGGIKVTL
jgi:outer membrane cobalamin receptor